MHEPRKVFGTRGFRPRAMFLLLDPHTFDNGPAPGIRWRQAIEMPFEVFSDLPLRLLHESERPSVTERAAGDSDGKRACIPARPEPARLRTQFPKALLAPAEVIELFRGRLTHVIRDRATPRHRRMTLVQPLRRHFTCVIDAHEARRVPTFRRRQW